MLYPILTNIRTVIDLNGIWKFLIENDDVTVDVTQPLITDDVMAVPGSYNDQAANDKVRYHVGDVWYEREFAVPSFLLNERLVLRFGSVTHFAKVYVNGQEVVTHKGGFTPFEIEINDIIKVGHNRLTIKVNNILDYTTLPVGVYQEGINSLTGKKMKKNDPNFDFFNYAGTHRPVKIYTTPQTYIEDLVFKFEVSGSTVSIHPEIQSFGEFDEIRVTAIDEIGEVVATASNGEALIIENFVAWEPMDAYLYTMHVEAIKAGNIIDSYEEPLGIRTIEVKGGQFLINDKPFYFKGFGKHEDTYINGRGLNEAANVLDLNLFK